ncbi:uncharacterized protein IL334_007466 [Kwoniella shivajii]|uniref:Uncharacterized protein n=1 Tax=Kwoniella shivajii TaxID=564305 RepID=A0ABZ1D9J4_9TREE|nr:hypothetical protein IL334_007466 [Kwoniella shivajii]
MANKSTKKGSVSQRRRVSPRQSSTGTPLVESTSRHPHAHPGTIGNTSDNPFLASWTNQDAQPYPPDPPANALGNLIAQIEAARAAPPGRNREFLVQTCRRLCRELGFTLESFTNEFRGEGEAGGSGSAHRG